MVLGIVSMVLAVVNLRALFPIVVHHLRALFLLGPGFAPGTLALIFGIIGLDRAGRGHATNKTAAIIGVVTGGIGLVTTIIFMPFAHII